tara:strand:+ start:31570 stop:31848 length:279 start_codon:yes stop_codon:yes gene_type:complete
MNANQLSQEQINEIHERFPLNCKLFNYTPIGRPLTNIEASAFCGFKPNTFEQKRMSGTGPAYIQPESSRRVLYPEPLLLDWLAAGLRMSTCA